MYIYIQTHPYRYWIIYNISSNAINLELYTYILFLFLWDFRFKNLTDVKIK